LGDFIKDGVGKGFSAQVNKDHQLITRATALNQHTKSVVDGNYFEATTGLLELTTAAETGVIYVKNSEDTTIIVDKVFFDVWPSTGGDTNGGTLRYYKNPDVTGGSSIIPTNTNFKYTVGEAGSDLKDLNTMTGGTVMWIMYFEPQNSLTINEEKIAIPPGYSIGISVAAPTGNSSMYINLNVAFYRLDEELI
jgi:hypothetical protein